MSILILIMSIDKENLTKWKYDFIVIKIIW